ncbi:MAG: CHAD domain-containing protein [Akkermansiaceae bacterium]|nr:CHAD domain-containing protein [Akkermansiaceae bacterium]
MNVADISAPLFAREKLTQECITMKGRLRGLLDSSGRVAEEIHAIRKLGKSLRGGFALFGLEKEAALEIQAVGRLLSEPRDAVSRFKTWNKLEWNEDAAVAVAISKLLEQQTHSAARRPPPETVDWCLSRVDSAIHSLATLDTADLEKTIGKGLAKLEKRVFKRCEKLDHRNEEDFHEARKSVKAWLGAIAFLPEGSIEVDAILHEMGELLGDENDLATLAIWLENHGFTKTFAPALWARIKSSRRALQKRVIRDGRKLKRVVAN